MDNKSKNIKEKTIKNKIYSAMFILLGALSIKIDNDITFFIFTLLIGIPIFFAKENVIKYCRN